MPTNPSMIRYVESKLSGNDSGPAWIGKVQLSRSGRTVYFNGKAFKRSKRVVKGNHYDIETGECYWISGIKKNGEDRHWAGSGKITIESSVVDEYLRIIDEERLDPLKYSISTKIKTTDPSKFTELENRPWPDKNV